jgi:hypothetical protein
MAHHALTARDIATAYDRTDWLGFGYLRERQTAIDDGRADRVTLADQAALDVANRRRWSSDRLFDWLNSKNGRWYGERAIYDTARDLVTTAQQFVI